jgi:hypothetical protein
MAPRNHPALQRGAQVEMHAVQTDHSPMAATKVRHKNEGHSHNQQGTNDPTSALGQGARRGMSTVQPGSSTRRGGTRHNSGRHYSQTTTNKARGTNSTAQPGAWAKEPQ